jgi:hypothetical protein
MTLVGQPPNQHTNNAATASKVAPQDQNFSNLCKGLTQVRMGRYLQGAGFDEKRAVDMYLWNVALSEAFNFPLHILEVTLRNRVHDVLKAAYVSDWHLHQPFTRRLEAKLCQSMAEAQTRIIKKYGGCTVDQLVASLSFGFWTALLSDAYYRMLWETNLRAVFPNMPGTHQLRHARINVAQSHWFRNRIAHHEPIFEEDLSKRYSEALTALVWLDSDLANWVRGHTRVPAIIRMKP